jgi:hypothetical protein
LLVVVQVFVTQRQPVNSLRQHLFETVRDPFRLPVVGKAASHPPQQVDLAIRLTKQERAAFGGQPNTLELSNHLP